jgi:mannose-6-phosphate isomerase-like protein (cupin superfamily)
MRKALISLVLLSTGVLGPPVLAQRGTAARTGPVTFAVFVTDPSGAPVTDVRVTMTGPVARNARTEGGRLVFEDLPTGDYQFRFEKPGFDPVDQTVTGKGSKPIPVNVTLKPTPPPPTPPAPAPPPAPPPTDHTDGKYVVLDMPAFIEKNWVGRAAGKTTQMACGAGGSSTLIQINEPIAEHRHADADEFIYVIAGEGTARVGDRPEPLGPGVFLMIPRGTAHEIAVGRKKPLVMMSMRAGEKCGG